MTTRMRIDVPKLVVSYDKSKQEVHFKVLRGIDTFTGNYTDKSAKSHSGSIINASNFLICIKATLDEQVAREIPDSMITFAQDDEIATITIDFESRIGATVIHDKIQVACAKEEFEDTEKALRETRLICAELHSEIREIRALLDDEREIAQMVARWGPIPYSEREFVLHVVRAKPAITFPYVGYYWVQVGTEIYRCTYAGIKTRSVICCTEPMEFTDPRSIVVEPAYSEVGLASGDLATRQGSSWEVVNNLVREVYVRRLNVMYELSRASPVIIGRFRDCEPLFAISFKKCSSTFAIDCKYEVAQISIQEYFGLTNTNGEPCVNTRDSRATTHQSIRPSYDGAIKQTGCLIKIAKKSLATYKARSQFAISTQMLLDALYHNANQ